MYCKWNIGTPTTTLVGFGNISVNIETAVWASEISWTITNSSGVIVAQGGSYTNYNSYFTIYCLSQGNYTFNWFDSYGDGWNGSSFTVSDPAGNTIVSDSPSSTSGSSGSSGSISLV